MSEVALPLKRDGCVGQGWQRPVFAVSGLGGVGRAGWHGGLFFRKTLACSGICENGLVKGAAFLPPKGNPIGHGEQTTGAEVSLAFVLGLLQLQPEEAVPENWLADRKSCSSVTRLPFCK